MHLKSISENIKHMREKLFSVRPFFDQQPIFSFISFFYIPFFSLNLMHKKSSISITTLFWTIYLKLHPSFWGSLPTHVLKESLLIEKVCFHFLQIWMVMKKCVVRYVNVKKSVSLKKQVFFLKIIEKCLKCKDKSCP